MQWYYDNGGKPAGPVDNDAFHQLVAAGSVRPETLVWREGQAEWRPLAEIQPVAPMAPAVAAPMMIGQSPATATAALVAAPAAASTCHSCGHSFPTDQLVLIAGASICAACKPRYLQGLRQGTSPAAAGLWRKGKQIVIMPGSVLPDRCVKCNATTDLRRYKRTLYWHNPVVYVALLLNVIIYAIIAVIVRKKAYTEVSLCGAHARRRITFILIGWAVFLVGIASLPLLINLRAPDWTLAVVPPLCLVAAIGFWVGSRLIHAMRIDENSVCIGGSGEAFRAGLPEWTLPSAKQGIDGTHGRSATAYLTTDLPDGWQQRQSLSGDLADTVSKVIQQPAARRSRRLCSVQLN